LLQFRGKSVKISRALDGQRFPGLPE
jgi:hypothetical protein